MKCVLLANKRKVTPDGQLTLQWVSRRGGDDDAVLENRCGLCDGRMAGASYGNGG